jgi:acyl dehydratase
MPIDPQALSAMSVDDLPVTYNQQDVMLYALGVGLCRDPAEEAELAFVSEHAGLRTLPTLASMLIPDTLMEESGCDLRKLLHRAQSLEFFRPLPVSGELLANQRVVSVADRGDGIGAEIELETEVRRASDDTVIFAGGSRVIARGDGGFGGEPPPVRSRHRMPNREPDMVCDLPTMPSQALLFRLAGDMNPLHSDPQVAAAAGFERPILHGRCTYGIACHAILKTVCNYDYTLIRGFDVRFSSPVFPGDVITTEMWQDRNVVSFRCRVKARNVVVLNNGKCTLAD